MLQQNSIIHQLWRIYHFTFAEPAFFRGVGEIDGVPSTILFALTDPGATNVTSVLINGEIRNPLRRQIFNGEVTGRTETVEFNGETFEINRQYVTFQDGFFPTFALLDLTEDQITIDPVENDIIPPFLTDLPQRGFEVAAFLDTIYTFEYEPTTLTYALDFLSLSPDFDAAQYGASHNDLITNIGFDLHGLIDALQGDRQQATLHYVSAGHFEQRPRNSFDSKQYLASHSDLLGAFGVNLEAAKDHFVDQGHSEGRSADNFSEFGYIASYSDLIQTFGLDGVGATDHYLTSGVTEGRDPFVFNPVSYMNLNPDVSQAVGGDALSATKHYIQFGWAEGRSII